MGKLLALLVWVLLLLGISGTLIAGYITHIVWFFGHPDQLILGLIGLIPIVGAIHGIMLW